MMKKYQSSLITSFMIMMLASMIMSCSKKSTSSSATNPVGTTDSSTTNGGGTSGDNTNTSGITCAGDNSDGFDDNPNDYQSYPLRIYQIALGGQKSWIPGNPAHRPEDKSFLKPTDQSACEPLACNPSEMTDRTKRSNRCYYCFRTGTSSNPTYVNTPFSDPIPLMKDVWSHSNNDGDIFFRLKIKSPKEFNLNGYGGAYCYGRVANDNGTYVPYTTAYSKIKLDIYARVLRKTTNCDINSNCTDADFTLMSTRYLIKSGIELDVNKCSTVIRLPFANLASTNADAVVLEFANVKTNVSCSAGSGTFCALNTANCWFATLQIATNETFFFKGYTRSAIPYN